MKKCYSCKLDKPWSEFYSDRSKPDGLERRCKQCSNQASRAAYHAKKELRRKMALGYYNAHKEQCQEKMRERYAGDKANQVARVRKWQLEHPEHKKATNHRRRTRKTEAGGSYTPAEWEARCKQFGDCCAYCKRKRKLTVHHVKPVSKGGTSFIDNLLPTCMPCNQSIGSKEIWPEGVRVQSR